MARRTLPTERSADFAWFITAPLALLSIGLTTVLAVSSGRGSTSWFLILIMLVAGAIANLQLVRLVVGRQGINANFHEIPLVLGFYYLKPHLVVLVAAAAALINELSRRPPAAKIWFNVARAGAGACAAGLVLGLLPPIHGVGPSTWGILFAVVMTNAVVTASAVIGVIGLLQGRESLIGALRASISSLVVGAIGIVVGLILLITVSATPWALVLIAGLAAALVAVYRSYAEFFRQHRTLADVSELTRAVNDSTSDGTLVDQLLVRVRAMVQAEYATLCMPALGRHPEIMLTSRVGGAGLLDLSYTPAAVRRRARDQGRSVGVSPQLPDDVDLQPDVRGAGVRDVIAVPLRSGATTIGTLEVVNRLAGYHFRKADVQVLETVAAHAAVAVENSRLVERLRYDTHHDRLSKLPNRRRVVVALAASVRVAAPDDVVAVCLFDVNGLRDVNESMGRAAGDKLLVEVARRLKAGAEPGALVGRIGGDEFVVTFRAKSAEAALTLAADLRKKLRTPMVFGSLALDVDTAVGVAVHPDHGNDPEALLQQADLAATAAKAHASGVQLFHPALESRAVRRLGLAGDLRQALEDGGIEVYFQPKVTLADRRLVGVECLARWEHPAHGAVAPEDFVAVAEHTGQLGRLTEVVLRDGLRRCRDWADADRPLAIAVNLSGRTLADPLFPDLVEQLLTEYGVAPGQVTFELAEPGEGGDLERALPILARLRELGVRLSVDDFGTGASSLSYLRRLRVHEVKIDGSCIQGMATDEGDLAVVRAVVGLAREFKLAVVAEGVESERTLGMLEELGCEIGQGYLFSRPLPYERLEAWFGARTEAESTPTGEVRRLRAVP